MLKIFNTKFIRSAPVVAAVWLSLTAGIIIEFNRFFPDLLFHPMSWDFKKKFQDLIILKTPFTVSSTSWFVNTKSNSPEDAISWLALLSLLFIASSFSVPLFLILFSNSALLGGRRNIDKASGNFSLICFAPSTSISSKTTNPFSIFSLTVDRGAVSYTHLTLPTIYSV